MSNNKRDRDRDFEGGQDSTLTMEKLAAAGYSFDLGGTGLIVAEDRTLSYLGFEFKATHLIIPDSATEEDFNAIFDVMKPIVGASSFWLGDAMNAAEKRHGEKYAEASIRTGLEEKTLRNYAYVCRNVDLSFRKDKLTFKHHFHVAGLEEQDQVYWLDRAVEEGLSAAKLKKLIEGKEDPVDWRKSLPEEIRQMDVEISNILQVLAAKEPISAEWLERVGRQLTLLWNEIDASNKKAESESES